MAYLVLCGEARVRFFVVLERVVPEKACGRVGGRVRVRVLERVGFQLL